MPEPVFPLYGGLDAPKGPSPSGMNMGLWFERFFHGYQSDFAAVDTVGRSAWLRQLNFKQVGASSELQAKATKVKQLAESQGGQVRAYQCTAPFVTGMGNPHPLENGFTWHPTLGMPYLPGSAVKGLVRAAVELAYQGEDKPALLKRWFGTEAKGDVPEASGSFIFLDALPEAPCALVPEVMTPHMGKWYEKGGKTPTAKDTQPGDWHSPVPVGYLTARDLHLQFAVMPRPGVAAAELELVWQALDYALQWLGAGAKTAQGFGVMESDAGRQRRLAEAMQRAEAMKQQQEAEKERMKAEALMRQQANATPWERVRTKFNSANKSLSVEKDGKTVIALAPEGEKLLQSLPADLQQKIRRNDFVKLTAYVAEGVLVRIEKA